MSKRNATPQLNISPFSQVLTVPRHNSPIEKTAQSFNALWISDVHLGSVDCKAEFLLHLLTQVNSKDIYLVGDIIDIIALKKRVYWPESHNMVIQKLLQLAEDGTNIIYIPGNHDEMLKPYTDLKIWGIGLEKEYIHYCISGEKILMVHGDQFDSEVCISRAYAKLGDHLYDVLLFLNRTLHKIRTVFGFSYWSLASYVKLRVNKAQHAIQMYREAVLRYAKLQQVDAVVCGHIHQPELSTHNGMIYANDGDWVENCTLIAETLEGQLQLLRWSDETSTTKVLKQIQLNHSNKQHPLKQKVA